MTGEEKDKRVPNFIVNRVEGPKGIVWNITDKLGSGSFGDVFLAKPENPTDENDSPSEVAVKTEPVKTQHPQLAYEARLLTLLAGSPGVAKVFHSGVQPERGYNVLVMERLSYSLEDLIVQCNGHFSLKTTLLVADQLLSRMEDLHAVGFVHRDIKPENFLLGRGENKDVIYVIDFGLSKRYLDPKTNRHIPYKDNKSLTGTARYASINAHRGIEQSRRDDLEALGHMLLYFLKGQLPWQGLPARTKEEKYRKIKEKKIETPIEILCAGLPPEINQYMHYTRTIRFPDRPDYDFLRGLFKDRFAQENFSDTEPDFDWTIKHVTFSGVPKDGGANPNQSAGAGKKICGCFGSKEKDAKYNAAR